MSQTSGPIGLWHKLRGLRTAKHKRYLLKLVEIVLINHLQILQVDGVINIAWNQVLVSEGMANAQAQVVIVCAARFIKLVQYRIQHLLD